LKAEADEEIKKSSKKGTDSLKELEGIKTMDWHKKPLLEVFADFNYK